MSTNSQRAARFDEVPASPTRWWAPTAQAAWPRSQPTQPSTHKQDLRAMQRPPAGERLKQTRHAAADTGPSAVATTARRGRRPRERRWCQPRRGVPGLLGLTSGAFQAVERRELLIRRRAVSVVSAVLRAGPFVGSVRDGVPGMVWPLHVCTCCAAIEHRGCSAVEQPGCSTIERGRLGSEVSHRHAEPRRRGCCCGDGACR